jgi:phosphoribosylformylglycinamidine synthase
MPGYGIRVKHIPHNSPKFTMIRPRVLILRSPGANCDGELAFAFEKAGAAVERIHIRALRDNPKLMHEFEILAIPGGFTYGDDVAAGKILASQLANFFADAIREFRDEEKLILGVCNGFQALLKAGLLIQPDEDGPLATLTGNACDRFEDRWITLAATPGKCPWLKDIHHMDAPTAHGEGNFRCRANWIFDGLELSGQCVLHYAESGIGNRESGIGQKQDQLPFPINPNGSQGNVAGVCDLTGRVLGIMPHPERNVLPTHHPQWTRNGLKAEGDGMQLFRNAVSFFG